jgi:hypothetical protein
MSRQSNADYAYWRAALKAIREGKLLPSIHVDAPQPGFYRRRFPGKDGPYLPAAIFIDQGTDEIVCAFNKKKDGLDYAIEHWTWLAKNPIDEHIYRVRIESGKWPDGADDAPKSNLPDDPFDALKIEYEDALESAQRILGTGSALADNFACDTAANLSRTLSGLMGTADELFEIEKKPIREAGLAVDAKYAFRKQGAEVIKKLKSLIGFFLAAEEKKAKAEAERKRQEEIKKAEEEKAAREAELKKLEAEDPALAMLQREELMQQPEMPLPAPAQPVKMRAGGGVGSKIGLKTVYSAEIVDYKAALLHFAGHPNIKALIQDLANGVVRATKGTQEIPGVRVVEERKAA